MAFIGPPRTNSGSVSLSKFPPLFMSTEAGDEWELRRGGRPGDETISVGERKRQAKGVDLESKFNSPQLLGFQLL